MQESWLGHQFRRPPGRVRHPPQRSRFGLSVPFTWVETSLAWRCPLSLPRPTPSALLASMRQGVRVRATAAPARAKRTGHCCPSTHHAAGLSTARAGGVYVSR
jgi:hypothetical protein